jgi:hypothetical protein
MEPRLLLNLALNSHLKERMKGTVKSIVLKQSDICHDTGIEYSEGTVERTVSLTVPLFTVKLQGL